MARKKGWTHIVKGGRVMNGPTKKAPKKKADVPPLELAAKKGSPGASLRTNIGSEYDADDLEFLKAMDEYRRDFKRPFPGCSEYLAVLKSLGYRKDTQGPLMKEALR